MRVDDVRDRGLEDGLADDRVAEGDRPRRWSRASRSRTAPAVSASRRWRRRTAATAASSAGSKSPSTAPATMTAPVLRVERLRGGPRPGRARWRERRRRPAPCGRGADTSTEPARRSREHDLLDEQRDAVGAGHDVGDKGVGRIGVEQRGEELADTAAARVARRSMTSAARRGARNRTSWSASDDSPERMRADDCDAGDAAGRGTGWLRGSRGRPRAGRRAKRPRRRWVDAIARTSRTTPSSASSRNCGPSSSSAGDRHRPLGPRRAPARGRTAGRRLVGHGRAATSATPRR